MSSSVAQKVITQKTASLELVRGYTEDKKPFFAYILIRQSDMIDFMAKEGLKTLPKNSLVLYSDYGHEVPEYVTQYVMKEFNNLIKKPD